MPPIRNAEATTCALGCPISTRNARSLQCEVAHILGKAAPVGQLRAAASLHSTADRIRTGADFVPNGWTQIDFLRAVDASTGVISPHGILSERTPSPYSSTMSRVGYLGKIGRTFGRPCHAAQLSMAAGDRIARASACPVRFAGGGPQAPAHTGGAGGCHLRSARARIRQQATSRPPKHASLREGLAQHCPARSAIGDSWTNSMITHWSGTRRSRSSGVSNRSSACKSTPAMPWLMTNPRIWS